MGRSRESAPPNGARREIEGMWLSLVRASWSWMVVIPTDPGSSAKAVTGALLGIERLDDFGPFRIIDAEGVSPVHGEQLARDVAAEVAGGARAVVSVDPPVQSLGGLPLIRDAEAALLVVRLGVSNFDSVQTTIDIVGRERILGAVTLPSRP